MSFRYDLKDTTKIHLQDVTLLAAMGPSGSCRQDVYERFLRHFSIYAMNVFTDDNMTRIFTYVLSTGLKVCLLSAECQVVQSFTVN
jgi:dynein heavy chain